MVINNEGIPLKSTLDSSTTVQYGGMVSDLAHHARSIGSRLGDIHTTHLSNSFLSMYMIRGAKSLNPSQSLTLQVRDLDPTNELTFLRVKSSKHEV